MEIVYTRTALNDIAFYKKTGSKALQSRIQRLINQIQESPFEGIGKPHRLIGDLSGCWAVKIDDKNRIVYEVDDNRIIIHSLVGHYFDK